jgi:hypothetical protein
MMVSVSSNGSAAPSTEVELVRARCACRSGTQGEANSFRHQRHQDPPSFSRPTFAK